MGTILQQKVDVTNYWRKPTPMMESNIKTTLRNACQTLLRLVPATSEVNVGDRLIQIVILATLFSFAAGLNACSPGSGEGLDANGRPLGESGGGGPLTAEFGSIQANVFTPTCATAGCHVGAAAPQGLRLDAASSFALLVSVPSNQVPSLLRVDPGNPDNSYLIQKMEGTAAAGGRMPLNGPPYLDQTTVDVIRLWISNGAPPPVLDTQPPQVVSIEPIDGAVVDQLPSEITVIFSQDMDGTLLSDATVLIKRSGGDATFGDGNEEIIQPAGVALDPTNLRLAIIDLTGIASVVDDYEIRLVGTGATALASGNGEILDGDGDGQPGGDFVSMFSVSAVSATLQSIQDNVFSPTCATAGCHDGPMGPGLPAGQDLSTLASSFASLVGVASGQVPSLLRVNPGNANDSYLIQKLEGTAASGNRMPLGGNPLSQTTINTIRDWITAGAASGGADVNPPTVDLQVLSSPINGTVNLSATSTDDVGVVQVSFFVDGTLIGSATTAPYEISWDTTTVADGDHELTAEARDAAGNVGTSASQTVAVDNGIDTTPPEVRLNALASPLSGTVAVSALATDDVGVTQVDFFVDGTLIGSDTVSSFEIQWDTTSVTNGDHELTALASDAAGNMTGSAPLTVTVLNDSQPPTVSITSPSDGDNVSGQLLVTISANDDVGVTEVSLLVNGVSVGTDTASPFEIIWDTTTVVDDRYELVARAMDAVGNSTDSATVRADVDNAGCANDPNPPTVVLTAPASGTVGGTITVSADATDDVGVTLVSFFAGGQLIGTDATQPYESSWDTTTVPNGNINLTAEATDGCNNTLSAAVTVTVSNAAQVFAVSTLSPGEGAVEVDFPSAISVTFTDNVNAATVGATTFVLQRSGGDGTFGDGNEAQLNAPVSANGMQASMNLGGILPSFEDTYRVTLSETITDLGGNMLDGDGDGTPGGNFIATFQTDLTTYSVDAQPIFQDKCDTCHTGAGAGGHNIGTVYADALQAAGDNACDGLTVGQCTIVLIQAGDMPQGAGCSGNPSQDAGNAACLTQLEQSVLQAWIDDRLPE